MSDISDEVLNKILGKLADDERFAVKGLEGSGKCIPYVGWYWRDVPFDHVWLGYCDVGDEGSFIGFMQNNKWGHREWPATPEQARTIRERLCEIVVDPTQPRLQQFFDYMQTLKA